VQTIVSALALLRRLGQTLGPYLMVEILLPGGTLLAFLLFLYRRRTAVSSPQPLAAMLRTVQASVRPTDVVVATTGYTSRELWACGDRENQDQGDDRDHEVGFAAV